MITDPPRPPTGRDIWEALKEELRNNLYPLPSVTLAPTVFHVYLHAEDFEVVEGIVARIVAEMGSALTREVDSFNRESARQQGGLRSWLRPTETASPIEIPAGGWEVHIQPDHDRELPRGRIGLVSKLSVPPRRSTVGCPRSGPSRPSSPTVIDQ